MAALLAAAGVAADAGRVAGQGSSVYIQSACASGRGGAAVATPCLDASSVYYNPGALALMPTAISAGVSAIRNAGSFIYDSTGVAVAREPGDTPLPQAYASYRFGARWAAGVGVFAPYGLGIEWPETFEGRFISWKSGLRGLYVQPTAAWQVVPGRLSVGAGAAVVLGTIELNQHADAPLEDPLLALLGVPLGTDIARARLAGSGVGFGGHVGAYWQATDRLAFGARYMHEVEVDLDGDADFEQIATGLTLIIPDPGTGEMTPTPLDALVAPSFQAGGPFEDQEATSSFTLPPQAVIGTRVALTTDAAVAADYQWTGWSTFDVIVAELENGGELELPLRYDDTHTFRLGADYAATPALDVRAGFTYNTAASPDESVTPVLPEAERNTYTAGLGYRAGAVRADLYYNFIDQATRRGRVRSRLTVPTPAGGLNTGVFTSTGHVVGITLSYVPGGAP